MMRKVPARTGTNRKCENSMHGIAPKATSIDVAQLAGVSQSTVSRTFSGDARVAVATREKVFAAAKTLNYTPNAIARSLITQRTDIVGIVMAYMTSPFYPYVLEKFVQKLQAIGRRALVFSAAPGQELDDLLPQVLQYQVDGLIVTSATLSSRMVDDAARRGTPVVLFNRYMPDVHVGAVCCDNLAGGRYVADLLLDAGHRHLAYIAGSENASTNRDREQGFGERLRERGCDTWLREQGQYTYESGYAALARLLDQQRPPDAVFCANDIMALGALDCARERGVRIPNDLSIIGFDDIPQAAWSAYALTTLRQPVGQMIDAAIAMLLAQIQAPATPPVVQLVPGVLVERRSARLRS